MALRWRFALMLALAVVLCLAAWSTGFADKDQKVTIDQLPAAVRATLESQAQGGTILDLEKETEDGIEFYSADIIRGNQKTEVEIALDGKLLKSGVEADDDDECGNNESDDEDEVQVTLDQLPAAVKATLLAQAGSGTIKEIEMEKEDGAVVYSADVLKDGQILDIEIAADGKLIKAEIDKEDNEDDDAD